MFSRTRLAKSVACLTLLLTGVSLTEAAPSLDPAAARTMTVSRKGNDGLEQDIRYTVIMDHKDPLRWYYFPSDPRIMMNGAKPVFSLLRYQLPGDENGAAEGGILQFATTLDLQEQEAKGLKSKIANALNNSRDPVVVKARGNVPFAADAIQLSGVPFSDCKVSLFAPSETGGPGKFVATASVEKGAGPKFGTQSMPFTLLLTKNGTDVYKALTTEGNAGLQVMYEVSYIGVTPPAGFSIEVDWEKTYEHFSKSVNHRTSFAANIMGVDLEGAVGVKNNEIVNSMVEDGSLKLTVLASKDFNKEDIAKYMDPLLQQIYKRIFDAPPIEKVEIKDAAKADDIKKEDATIAGARTEKKKTDPKKGDGKKEPAKGDEKKEDKPKEDEPKEEASKDEPTEDQPKGDDPKAEGADAKESSEADGNSPSIIPVIRSETNIAMKSVKDINKTKLRFDMQFQNYEEQSTVVGGFIGIGGFPKETREGMVRTVGEGNWAKAIFALPDVDLKALNVASLSLTVDIVDAKGRSVMPSGGQLVKNLGNGWFKSTNNSAKAGDLQRLDFPLASTRDKLSPEEFDQLQYSVTVTMTPPAPAKAFDYTYLVPLEVGETALASPTSNIRYISIDPEGIMGDYKQVYVKASATWAKVSNRVPAPAPKADSKTAKNTKVAPDTKAEPEIVVRSAAATVKPGAVTPIVLLLPPSSTGLAPTYDLEVKLFPQSGPSILKKLTGLTEENLFLEDSLWDAKP